MGLYACKECGRDVSNKAVACQHCGCPTASKGVWRSLNELNTPITYVFIFIGILVIYLLINANDFFAVDNKSSLSQKLSHLGDFFGGILTPLLTFISVILLITTLKLTRDSVDISKRELMLSRQAMAESAIALQNQAESLEVQNFNNLFFNLLKYHEASVSSLDFQYLNLNGAGKVSGRECFIRFYEHMSQGLTKPMKADCTMSGSQEKNTSRFKSFSILQEDKAYFDNYITTFTTILNTIDNADKFIRKDEYVDILKSQLTAKQVFTVLYLVAVSDDLKGLGFKKLLIKYDFLSKLTIRDRQLEFFIKESYK